METFEVDFGERFHGISWDFIGFHGVHVACHGDLMRIIAGFEPWVEYGRIW